MGSENQLGMENIGMEFLCIPKRLIIVIHVLDVPMDKELRSERYASPCSDLLVRWPSLYAAMRASLSVNRLV